MDGPLLLITEPGRDETLAVIGPAGQILGTDDQDLIQRIQSALQDPTGGYNPQTGAYLPGPPAQYEAGTADAAVAASHALARAGLCVRPVGYPLRKPRNHQDRQY